MRIKTKLIAQQTISINTPAIASSTTPFAKNEARIGWFIQNCGTNALYVCMGGTASTTVFHAVLKGGTGNDDGSGGSIGQEQGVIFTGPITVAGTNPRFVCTEFAP
jgi:hypothetical protein